MQEWHLHTLRPFLPNDSDIITLHDGGYFRRILESASIEIHFSDYVMLIPKIHRRFPVYNISIFYLYLRKHATFSVSNKVSDVYQFGQSDLTLRSL